MNYTDRTILVTGGAGFIGSHIVDELVKKGAHVTVFDNFSTGSYDNLAESYDHIIIIHGDICDYNALSNAMHNQSLVFHCAAMTSVPESMTNPLACHDINVTGTCNVLEAMRQHNVTRCIFSSSSAVYGAQDKPCSENMVCAPIAPYGFSKLIAEWYCTQYSAVYGIETIIQRYFNVYGPRQNHEGSYAAVYTKFMHAMEHNKPITIFGDGRQTRDFICVHDIVYNNLLLGNLSSSMVHTYKLNTEPINIAQGQSTSIYELFLSLKKSYPSYDYNPTFTAARSGDIAHSHANCQKLAMIQKHCAA